MHRERKLLSFRFAQTAKWGAHLSQIETGCLGIPRQILADQNETSAATHQLGEAHRQQRQDCTLF